MESVHRTERKISSGLIHLQMRSSATKYFARAWLLTLAIATSASECQWKGAHPPAIETICC